MAYHPSIYGRDFGGSPDPILSAETQSVRGAAKDRRQAIDRFSVPSADDIRAELMDRRRRGVPFGNKSLEAKYDELLKTAPDRPMVISDYVDLSGLLGTPSQDLAPELPVDLVLPGECWYCKSKATHTKGSGEPLCRYHKQFFWSKPIIEEDETCKS